MAEERTHLINRLLRMNQITVCSFIYAEAKKEVTPRRTTSDGMRDFQKYMEWEDDDYAVDTLIRKYYYIQPVFFEYSARLQDDANSGIIQQTLTTAFLSVWLYFWTAGMNSEGCYEEQRINEAFLKFMKFKK